MKPTSNHSPANAHHPQGISYTLEHNVVEETGPDVRLPSQWKNMLHQTALPTKRTLWLLPCPVADASPAENMPTCRDAGVFHLFQAQRALSVAPAYPAHCLLVLELVFGLVVRRCIRPLLQI